MMIPAAAIAVVLTAAYALIAASPIARAALSGIAPVTGGMTIATAAISVRASARRGRTHFAIDVAVSVAFVPPVRGRSLRRPRRCSTYGHDTATRPSSHLACR